MALSVSTDAGNPVVNTGLVEGVNNDGAGDTPIDGDGQSAAGMVV